MILGGRHPVIRLVWRGACRDKDDPIDIKAAAAFLNLHVHQVGGHEVGICWTVAIIYALYIAAAFFSSFARIDPSSMHKMIRATHLHIRHFFVKKKSKKDRKKQLLLLIKKYNSQAFAALKAKLIPVLIDAVAWSFCPLFLFVLFYSYEGFRQDTWLVIFLLAS